MPSAADHSDVIIVDYGMGNLFSVKQACERAGLRPVISREPRAIDDAAAVILPGVGAFGEAMAALGRTGLDDAICLFAQTGKPLLGICLGMQLLMTESHEFGRHRGLNLIEGEIVRLKGGSKKVPHVGWNRIFFDPSGRRWQGGFLKDLPDGVFMYFVHSFYAVPADEKLRLSSTHYGETTFCSAIQIGNIFACQFHPERSAGAGIQIYKNFGGYIRNHLTEASLGQNAG